MGGKRNWFRLCTLTCWMAGQSPTHRRWARRLVVVSVVAVGWFAVDHLARMDGRLFGSSLPAARALAHYFVGDYGGAARLYRDALRHGPAMLRSSPAPSWSLLARGEFEQAEVQARIESRAVPTDPEPVLTLAEIALARRDNVTALTEASRVLKLRRDDYDALFITAVAHARQGAHGAAIGALGRALRYDRVERRLTVFLAVLETTGELDDRPIAQRPHCLLAHMHRYLRIYDASHARPAWRYAHRAIEIGDHADAAYVTLGVIHTKQGRHTRAFTAFQQALAVNPHNTAALLGAARFRDDRGEVNEVHRLLEAASKADGDDRFLVNLFHAFLVDKLGDYRQALALAEAALAADPNDGDAWSRRGYVYTQLGDHRAALHSFQRAAPLVPPTAELQDQIGVALAELGRDDEAIAAYRRAIALDPRRPHAHYNLAVLHHKAKRWTEAIKELETVSALGGGLPVGLCEIYFEVGRLTAATLCATAVLTADPDNVQGLALMEHVRGAATAGIAR